MRAISARARASTGTRPCPRPADLAAEHLEDVFLAPSFDDVAGDVLAIGVAGGDDIADLLLALLPRFLLGGFLGRELPLGLARAGRRRLFCRRLRLALRGTVLGFERAGGDDKSGRGDQGKEASHLPSAHISSALTMASPISRVPTVRQPSCLISAVRRP